jgi:prolyl-tRNA editing enzyme YbaK/EbsC (Cys-tRNA(Pro) deacylase)
VNISVELTEHDIKRLICEEIAKKTNIEVETVHNTVLIQVKSKQNFKSEWEEASIKAHFIASI